MYLKYFPFLQIRHVISSTAHTHEGNESAIQAAKIRQTMKDHVTVNRGRPGPSVWTIIDAFRKDHAMVEMQLFQDANSQPPRKRVKAVTRNLQERLRNLCSDFVDDRKNLEEFLHGVGHCIRWK